MLKKSFMAAIVMLLGSGILAEAGCTPEEAQAKAQKFMESAVAFAQKDPKQYQEVAMAMQKELPELQQAADIDKVCEFYDKWLEKMQ